MILYRCCLCSLATHEQVHNLILHSVEIYTFLKTIIPNFENCNIVPAAGLGTRNCIAGRV